MNTRRAAGALLSFAGLVLLAKTPDVQAGPASPLKLVGPAVAGDPVSFSVTGAAPSSSIRIVVIPGALVDRSGPSPLITFGCYTGTPTALGTADATTDPSGNAGPILVWTSATPGTYTAYLLQGACAGASTGGRSMQASTDTHIVAIYGFDVAGSVPALSAWGLAALGLALSIAGWAFLSRTRA